MQSAIIVGGGSLGSCLFRELSLRGMSVTLVAGSGGASWHSFSWLNAAAPTTDAYRELRVQGVLRHLLYSAPRGIARFDGVLAWDGDTVAEPVQGSNLVESVVDACARLSALGHGVDLIDAGRAALLEPSLRREALGDGPVLWSLDEGWVDLPSLVAAVRGDAIAAGGVLVEGEAERLLPDASGGRVRGVVLASGETLSADVVIVAAGAGTAPLLADAGYEMPVEESFGLVVRTAPLRVPAPRRILRGPEVSIRPEPGNRVVLHSEATDPSARSGAPSRPDALRAGEELLRRAGTVLAAERIEIQSVDYGRRPLPGDHFPVVGFVPGGENLYAFHSHSGATVCLCLAELAAREILQGARSLLLRGSEPGRFSAPAAA